MLISQMGLYPLWLNLPMQQLFWTKCFSTTTKDSGPCMEVRLILRWSRNNFSHLIKAEDHSSPRCSEKKKYKKYSSRPNACICSDYKVPTERGSLLIRAQLIFVPFKAFLGDWRWKYTYHRKVRKYWQLQITTFTDLC